MIKAAIRKRQDDDSGAVAVIASISMILLFMITALTIDLGFARADVRHNQSSADFAALAGAVAMGDGYTAACEEAVNYVFANSEALTSGSAEHADATTDCTAFDALDTGGCTAGDPDIPGSGTPPVTVTIASEPYVVTITSPVDNDDAAMTVEGQTLVEEIDGTRCDRLKVGVVRDRNYMFAPAGGLFEGSAYADAVSRRFDDDDPDAFASLLVLERTGCGALEVSGQAGINVVDNLDASTGEVLEGRIGVDTIGAGCNAGGSPKRAIEIANQSNLENFICAAGSIQVYGLRQGTPVDKIYRAADLTTPTNGTCGVKLNPQPVGGRLRTRKQVDHLINCLPEYGLTSDPWQPQSWGTIDGCEDSATRPPYIQRLVESLQSGTLPGTFRVFPRPDTTDSCTSAEPIVINGDTDGRFWHIQCPSGGQGFNPGSAAFTNVEVVVSNNKITLGSQNRLTITGRPGHGAILYVRNGELSKGAQATLTLNNTFTYLHNGVLNAGAGANVLTMRTPLDSANISCADYESGMPPASCFVPLALWTNSAAQHTLGGQAPLDIAGAFFTPNANPFNLDGQANQVLTEAQFIARRITISGTARITLSPDRDSNIAEPEFRYMLIR